MRIAGITLLGIAITVAAMMLRRFFDGPFLLGFAFMLLGVTLTIIIALFPYIKAGKGPLVVGKLLEIKKSKFGSTHDTHNLTVQFSTIDGQQVTATGKAKIHQDERSCCIPGVPIPLRYWPEKPKWIILAFHESSENLKSVFAARQEKIEKGPFVFGTPVSMKQIGVQTENWYPLMELRLQFNTVEGQKITASSLEAGDDPIPAESAIPLRYNPDDPEQIIIGFKGDLDEATVRHAFNTYMVENGLFTQREVDMRNNGVKAAGVILSSQPTGHAPNGSKEMTLNLKVTRPENGGTFDASINKVISSDLLASVLPGSVVDVYYMAGNEKDIVVDTEVN